MKFILLIYLLLGIGVSAIIKEAPTARFGYIECLFLAAMHVPFIAFGVVFARSSKPTNGGYSRGLSPGGWVLAMVLSYLIGFFGFMMAKR